MQSSDDQVKRQLSPDSHLVQCRSAGSGRETRGSPTARWRAPGVAAAWEAASAAHAPTPEQEQANEAVLALIALGYKQIDAHKAVRDLQEKGEAKSAEELVKLTLKKMAAGR